MAKSRKERMEAVRAAADKVRESSGERPAASPRRRSSGRFAPRKKATLAAFLSLVFPGAGLLYLGEVLFGGLVALIVLGAFFAAAFGPSGYGLWAVLLIGIAYSGQAILTLAVAVDARE